MGPAYCGDQLTENYGSQPKSSRMPLQKSLAFHPQIPTILACNFKIDVLTFIIIIIIMLLLFSYCSCHDCHDHCLHYAATNNSVVSAAAAAVVISVAAAAVLLRLCFCRLLLFSYCSCCDCHDHCLHYAATNNSVVSAAAAAAVVSVADAAAVLLSLPFCQILLFSYCSCCDCRDHCLHYTAITQPQTIQLFLLLLQLWLFLQLLLLQFSCAYLSVACPWQPSRAHRLVAWGT